MRTRIKFFRGARTGFQVPFLCGTWTILIFFFKTKKLEVLHKSQEQPNTASNQWKIWFWRVDFPWKKWLKFTRFWKKCFQIARFLW
jgi:hypothetical protein